LASGFSVHTIGMPKDFRSPGYVVFGVIRDLRALPHPNQEGYQPGSREDFDRLYRGAYPRVYRTLAAILGDPAEAEDCAQDAFVKAFQAWKRWRPDAPAEAWIHRIAVNKAISYRRRARLRTVGELLRRLGRPAGSTDPAHTATRPDLLAALRSIPPKLAAAIVLRHYHGYNNREIAAALGVSERTIGTRLNQAAERLRALLQENSAGGFSLESSAALSSEQDSSSYAQH
jgi:RNA polymerase sigma-70 factor, ECF subfamily